MGIIRFLVAFDAERRLETDGVIFDYWKTQKLNKPELYLLAQIALSFTVTQVSVERAFSSLKCFGPLSTRSETKHCRIHFGRFT